MPERRRNRILPTLALLLLFNSGRQFGVDLADKSAD